MTDIHRRHPGEDDTFAKVATPATIASTPAKAGAQYQRAGNNLSLARHRTTASARVAAVAGWLAHLPGALIGVGIATIALATPAAAQTQADMNARASTAYKSADAAMTAQWQRTYAAMKRRDAADGSRGGGFGYAAATLASQRAWLGFRDRQCVIEGGEFAGGSLQPFARLQCAARLTKERTAQLKGLMWQR